MMSRFHCCATCQHYTTEKKPGGGLQPKCARLGFATHPKYQFNCWNPKENVRKLMAQEPQR